MPERTAPRLLPLPSETSHITRRKPSQPLPVETQQSQRHLPQHTCDTVNCAAKKVLSTPELLENILIHLSSKDSLSFQLVSRTWHNLITTSPSLRLHHFIEPQWRRPTPDFQLLPCTFIPGMDIRRGEPVHLGQWIEVEMTLGAAQVIATTATRPHDQSPSNDIRAQKSNALSHDVFSEPWTPATLPQTASLLITQPPVVGMQALVVDGQHPDLPATSDTEESPIQQHDRTTSLIWKLACDAGITLGFMADVAQRLLRDHRDRSDGESERGQQDEGEMKVVFRAIVSFCSQTDIAPRRRSGTRFVTGVD